jgi:hypothetical protein
VDVGHGSFVLLSWELRFWLSAIRKFLAFLCLFFFQLEVGEDVEILLNRMTSWGENEVIDWDQNFL